MKLKKKENDNKNQFTNYVDVEFYKLCRPNRQNVVAIKLDVFFVCIFQKLLNWNQR